MHTYDIAALNHRFAIPGQVEFVDANDGFPLVRVSNAHAEATIALQGAHLMTWQPRDQEPVIWLSPLAKLAPGKSIRGGVPICWPWFGPHADNPAAPAHGHARTVPWQVVEVTALADGATRLAFELVTSDATRALWPRPTPVRVRLTVGKELRVELVTHNDGDEPVTLGEALHTYFQVSDIGTIEITGLDGCTYVDKVDAAARKVQEGPVTIAAEVDRVYVDSKTECIIVDPGYRRRIHIAKEGSRSTVVWNPWTDKAAKMGDFGDNGFRRMVCVESANALENCVGLAPGGEHRLTVTYSVESL